MELAPPWDPFWVAHMVAAYRRLLGRELRPEPPQGGAATFAPLGGADAREERAALLAAVARDGYATG